MKCFCRNDPLTATALPGQSSTGGTETILVVEDVEVDGNVAAHMLRSDG